MYKNKKLTINFFKEGWLSSWKPFVVLFAAIFIIYGQSIFFELTYLDDNNLFIDHHEIISNIKSVGTIFSSDAFFSSNRLYYRPLLNFSFMMEAQFGGSNYLVYHLFNLFWHFLATALFFILLKRLSGRPLFSFLASLIFSIHPVISQAVVWLPGRNDSLLAVFILASFLSFLNYFKKPSLKNLLLYSLFFFLALLSKETSLFFPLLIFIYLLTKGKEKKLTKTQIIPLIILPLVFIFFWFSLRSFALGDNKIDIGLAVASVFTNLLPSIAMGAKMFLPFNLSVLPTAADTSFFLSLIAWPAFFLACFYFHLKNIKIFIFGFFWWAIFFFPPFFVSSGAPFLLEHRLYLPLIGFLIALSAFDGLKNISWSNKYSRNIIIFILVLFALISFFHSRKFSNPLVFWQSAVLTSPSSPLAHKNLAVIYYFSGNYFGAEREYNMALKVNPQEAMINNNLGLIYMNRGEYWRAETAFRRELELNPEYDKAFANLTELYFKIGKYKEARIYALEALRINPDVDSVNNLLPLINQNLNKTEDSLK
jgi:hypothetical protein